MCVQVIAFFATGAISVLFKSVDGVKNTQLFLKLIYFVLALYSFYKICFKMSSF